MISVPLWGALRYTVFGVAWLLGGYFFCPLEATVKLTKKVIEAAIYEGGTDYRWDDAIPGFGLRVYASGRKSFVVSYRTRGRKRIMVLGQFGVLTVDQARKRALVLLAEVTQGVDPSGDRQAGRAAPTVKDLAARYMRDHAIPKKKPKSVEEDRRMFAQRIIPVLGQQKVDAVERDDVARLHASLSGTPYAANRVLALLKKAFNLAESWGWRTDGSNPCRHVDPFREQSRERFLSPQELARLGAVLAEAERLESEPREALAAIRLLLLTGCRKSEILTLKWRYIDFDRRLLFLPDSKTGAKIVPLGAAVIAILQNLERTVENDYVLPGRNGTGHLVGLHRVWNRIREQAGLGDVRLHDLRHSFASVGAGDGMGLPILGKILGHASAATTARYAHLATDPLLLAADQISDKIATGLGVSGRGE